MKRSPLKPGSGFKSSALAKSATKEASALAKIRLRKCCKHCRQTFEPARPSMKVCSPDCAEGLVLAERVKTERKADKVQRENLKSRADWERETQTAVNAFIRLVRDADKTCISCGRWHDGQWHAGHYLSRGARPGLRYVEANIAKQCMPCNVHLSGNQVNFRIGLIARIGIEAVEALEADHAPRKHTVEELKAIKAAYVAKLKDARK